MFDYSHYSALAQGDGQVDKLMALINSQDDIGIYLRAHLLIEQTLESWIVCASGNKEFFSGFGENINLDFAAKAQLAKNFGMSGELHKFVKKFNTFRNKRSHQIEHSEITSSEIDSLTGLMQLNYPSKLPSIRNFKLGVYEGNTRVVNFSDSTTSLRDKLIMLYAMFSLRANFEAELLGEC